MTVNSDQSIHFVEIAESDFPQLNEWLRIPHVAKWWYPDVLPWDEFHAKYKRNLESHSIEGFIICIDNKRIGFIQAYDASENPDAEGNLDPYGTWGMDLYIADVDFLGKGYGSKVIAVFMESLQKKHNVSKFIIDPHADNQIAIRTYKKVGFKPVGPRNQHYGEVLLMEKRVHQ